jgi:hypothetical protein
MARRALGGWCETPACPNRLSRRVEGRLEKLYTSLLVSRLRSRVRFGVGAPKPEGGAPLNSLQRGGSCAPEGRTLGPSPRSGGRRSRGPRSSDRYFWDRALGAVSALLTLLTLTSAVAAGPRDVVVLPAASASRALPDAELDGLLPRLDQLATEAAQDLGFSLSLVPRKERSVPTDEQLVSEAHESWVVLPTLEREGRGLRLKLVALSPGSSVLLTRSELSSSDDLDVRVAVMMRDLLQMRLAPTQQPRAARPLLDEQDSAPPRSAGRAVLALNSAAFGGYLGFSIQAASGSGDERLVYPLAALGTGIGLGASMLVADEWDISVGGAWFLSAGLWWPTSTAQLLAANHGVAKSERHVYSVVSGTAGAALAVAAMSLSDIDEGDAALVHSGGALGLGLGGLTQLFLEGRTKKTPSGGMGYGGALGALGAGVLATQVRVRPSRVLFVDVGATLGALAGAAAGSPLLLVDEDETKGRTRAWLGSIFTGTVVGAGLGWLATAKASSQPSRAALPALPYAFATPEATGARFETGLVGRF